MNAIQCSLRFNEIYPLVLDTRALPSLAAKTLFLGNRRSLGRLLAKISSPFAQEHFQTVGGVKPLNKEKQIGFAMKCLYNSKYDKYFQNNVTPFWPTVLILSRVALCLEKVE